MLISTGLAGAIWSVVDFRPVIPNQDIAVVIGAANPIESPKVAEAALWTTERPSVLYPNRPVLGDKVGTITMPALNQSWPIFEGTTEEQLSKGVGHFVESVLPGLDDNSVLSGHRSTVFNRLGELDEGDLILVGTSAGEFIYQIRDFQVVARTDRSIIVPTSAGTLTLTTCHPFNQIGRTTNAFIVSADLIDSRYRKR